MPNMTVFAGKHPVAPLPFDPTRLKGLSERLIRSHRELEQAAKAAPMLRPQREGF